MRRQGMIAREPEGLAGLRAETDPKGNRHANSINIGQPATPIRMKMRTGLGGTIKLKNKSTTDGHRWTQIRNRNWNGLVQSGYSIVALAEADKSGVAQVS
jgi:hypothetical protein